MNNVQAWQCVFCGKLYKARAKHHCEKHEKYCKDNPANNHKCFDFCEHLEAGYQDIPSDYDDDAIRVDRTFTCKVTGKLMHSYIAERRGLGCVSETDRMPLECEHYKNMGESFEEDMVQL